VDEKEVCDDGFSALDGNGGVRHGSMLKITAEDNIKYIIY
jgi:hypothetical protein